MDVKKKGFNIGFALGALISLLFVAGIVLWQIPIPSHTPPPGCTNLTQVRPIEWKADSSENKMMLILANEAGVRVRLNDVEVDVFANPCTGGYVPSPLPELRAGEITQVNVTGCTFPDVGDYYRAKITISYTNLVSGIEHKGVGECQGSVDLHSSMNIRL